MMYVYWYKRFVHCEFANVNNFDLRLPRKIWRSDYILCYHLGKQTHIARFIFAEFKFNWMTNKCKKKFRAQMTHVFVGLQKNYLQKIFLIRTWDVLNCLEENFFCFEKIDFKLWFWAIVSLKPLSTLNFGG